MHQQNGLHKKGSLIQERITPLWYYEGEGGAYRCTHGNKYRKR